MAKKNSSKTATEKAIQSSEPRVLAFQDWQGVNFADSPLTWEPLETGRYKHRQSDLPKNFFMVQNNLVTTDTLGIETRMDSKVVGQAFDINYGGTTVHGKFTGVSCVFGKYLFCVIRFEVTVNSEQTFFDRIAFRDLTNTDPAVWNVDNIKLCRAVPIESGLGEIIGSQPDFDPTGWSISEIGIYENNLIAIAHETSLDTGAVFLADLNFNYSFQTLTTSSIRCDNWWKSNPAYYDYITQNVSLVDEDEKMLNAVVSQPTAVNPIGSECVLTASGMSNGISSAEGDVNVDTGAITNNHVVRVEVCFAYTTRFGSSLPSSETPGLIFTEFSPTFWSSARYVQVNSPGTTVNTGAHGERTVNQLGVDTNIIPGSGINGIDFYGRDTENTDWVFIGHINITPAVGGVAWSYKWVGNMVDISQWTNSQLTIPTSNDTRGPNVSHFSVHDSRLYYWGDPAFPYRLYIGGNPGSEFSVARGLGGAWVDIEPGSGYEIKGTAKWKTVSGANIVTIMCGNNNTNKVKRFNLVETNVTITNEISYKGYMYEEVSNVVGCNSRYGYGVYSEGLYSISRYGLMLTTMAMEYNAQMRNQGVSDPISPIFTERIGTRLKDARMVCINDIIYISLSEDEPEDSDPIALDNVILCYDINKKAWYTFTHDETLDQEMREDPDVIHHIFAIDSDQAQEGLGVITDEYVYLYPTTGIQDPVPPEFQVIIESGEITARDPMQMLGYIQQLEFRFDYFISDPLDPPTILVEGTDYYGRSFTIEKQLNIDGGRGKHGKTTEMRDYVEWIRVDKYVDSFRIRIKGKARFRLTHVNCKLYVQADVVGTQWGFDAHDHYLDAHGTEGKIHHYINDYNNLRRAVIS